MDSLFSSTGPVGACTPPCTGGESHFAHASTKSVQVCTCRSPPSHLKAAAVLNSASLTEESTCKNGAPSNSFNPFLLIASHSTIPAPLKFLWINRKGEQASETEDSVCIGHTQDALKAECEKLFNDSREFDAGKTTQDESIVLAESVVETESVSVADNTLINAASIAVNETTAPPLLGHLISKIGSLWPALNYLKMQSVAADKLPSSEQMNLPSETSSVCKKPCHTTLSSQNTKDDVLSSSDVDCGCRLEAPPVRVTHTKESFSKFLQETSLFDMKVFTQMAFLCDTAYMIPSIQSGQLMRYHHLRLVTTSLLRKAKAEVSAKGMEPLKEVATSESEATILNEGEGRVNEHASHMNDAQHWESATQSSKECVSSAQSYASMACLPEEITSFHCQADSSQKQQSQVFTQLDEMQTVDKSTLVAMAQITAGAIVEEDTKVNVRKEVSSIGTCPCEWFICDEQNTHTRIFVIQGSESLASWQTNLFFEPTQFEGLDVSVHRGIYDAARALYDQLLPEVIDHLSRHGDLARVRFTGHSLGGSLSMLLALMLQVKGVLPRTRILPVVTFGSPFIMCGGDHLLQKLQLPVNHIQSVIMHRDIVPRAFACDYPDHVAEVLRRLNGRFRDHPCLSDQKLLYAPMGQLYILQPAARAAPHHPLLPDGHGLYLLKHPSNGSESQTASELRAAQRAFLNIPHPLDILSDPAAYGFDGTVSRDHDPRSYTKAIQGVLKHGLRRLRRNHREHRRRVIWPSLIMASSSTPSKIATASQT